MKCVKIMLNAYKIRRIMAIVQSDERQTLHSWKIHTPHTLTYKLAHTHIIVGLKLVKI